MRGICAAIGFLCLILRTDPAIAEKRVALVIGNAAYKHTTPLRNPANDATDVSKRLKTLGFKVIVGIDQTEAQFADRLAEFAEAAIRADVVLFFFAGHGLQFQGTNFLVPVDARLENQFQVRQQTVTLDNVVRLMESRASKVMVFLDACRDNPFASKLRSNLTRSGNAASLGRGLARVQTRAPETLVTFAAAPGTVAADGTGRNSPFTEALLKHVGAPNIEVEVMLKRVTASVMRATKNKQRPERLSRMTSEFYFVRETISASEPSGDETQQEPDSNNLALAAQLWADVKNTPSQAVLESFIQTFEGTVYAVLAKEKLAALRAPKLPATCRAVRDQNPATARDGEAMLYVNGDADMPYKVWCAGMTRGEPAEYLTLGRGNQSVIVHGGAYDGAGGRDMVTQFTRVRFDPERQAILPKDLKFAKTKGSIHQTCCENGGIPKGTRKPIPPAFGIARNCNAWVNKPRIARARVDISRTAFRIAADMKWKAGGFFPRKTNPAKWSTTPNGRSAQIAARTGFCAVIGPVGGIIRLTYVGSRR